MKLQDEILQRMIQQKGRYLSGAALAGQFGVSRSAVWKAVCALRAKGHRILSSAGLGYCLLAQSERLSAGGIAGRLRGAARGARIQVRDCVSSTNTLLHQMAQQGAPEGTVLLAEEQTAGRGRLGRGFYSPPGSGLYMSVLLRPALPAAQVQLITVAAAVAAASAAQPYSEDPVFIKWVNDLYCRGRKICGILTEAAFDCETGGVEYAVLGIGLNVLPIPDLPRELEEIAGSLLTRPTCPGELKEALAAEILNRFFEAYAALPQKPFMAEYRARSFVPGHTVRVLRGGEEFPAYAVGIDENAGLLVEYPDGRRETLSCGEVSIRPDTVFSRTERCQSP